MLQRPSRHGRHEQLDNIGTGLAVNHIGPGPVLDTAMAFVGYYYRYNG